MRGPRLVRVRNRLVHFFCRLLLALGCALCVAAAQAPPVASAPPAPPTITFTFDLPQTDPSHYVIAVDAGGNASYQAHGDDPDDSPYRFEFRVSDSARDSLFAAARELNYFQGDFDYRKSRIAFTGAKKLDYTSPDQQGSTTYNWSQDVRIQRITTFFQNLSNTLEFGRRIGYLHKHDKLGIDAELKRMEEMARNGDLAELQVVAPVLQKVAADPAVINLARKRAEALLARIPAPSAAHP